MAKAESKIGILLGTILADMKIMAAEIRELRAEIKIETENIRRLLKAIWSKVQLN